MNNDLISRQQAIDAMFNLCDRLSEPCYRCENPHIDVIVDELEQLPSAQPEIVHCGECRHYVFVDDRMYRFPIRGCSLTGFRDVDAGDFCSRAERRTE